MKLESRPRRRAHPLVCAAKRALLRYGEEGSTLVEFALTAPILVMILSGTVSFAMAMYNLQLLSNATTNTVQTVAAEQGLAADDDPCEEAASVVTAALPSWKSSKFSYSMTITYINSSNVAETATYTAAEGATFSCTAGSAELALTPPVTVTLTATYAYSWLPIWAFSPKIPLTSTQGALVQ